MLTRVLNPDDPLHMETILDCLAAGGLAALPTETVYGLAGDATNGVACARIFEAKGRPSFNPLIAHVADLGMARTIAVFSPLAERLAAAFWPGPLTLVLQAAPGSAVHPLATVGLPTIAVRMPDGAARAIVSRFGRPLAAPSANRSGRVSPTSAEDVLRTLDGRIDLVLDGGRCPVGLESTIVKVEDDAVTLLRPGGVTPDAIEAAIGVSVRYGAGTAIEAPGQMHSHYAPAGRVRLEVTAVHAGEHLIAFGAELPIGSEHAAAIINLSRNGDLREAAANLFRVLAAFDRPEIERIAVMPIPRTGLGLAINDRLSRAAAPR